MKLDFFTPVGVHYEESATSVIIPLIDGLAGIMRNHIPLLAKLNDGIIQGKDNERKFKYFVKNGFIEVISNAITILADEVYPC